MRFVHRIGQAAVAVAATAAVIGGASAYATESAPGGPPNCGCTPGYFPVVCSNGYEYFNSCFAACAGQSGCVPVENPGEM